MSMGSVSGQSVGVWVAGVPSLCLQLNLQYGGGIAFFGGGFVGREGDDEMLLLTLEVDLRSREGLRKFPRLC